MRGIRIEAGWVDGDGLTKRTIFEGLSFGGNPAYTAPQDVLTLGCKDFVAVLEDNLMVNSPYFDGMAVDHAVVRLLEKAGWPGETNRRHLEPVARSQFGGINQYVLPVGLSLEDPRVKFKYGKKIYECITEIAGRFWLVFYYDPKDPTSDTDTQSNGWFRLTTLHGTSQSSLAQNYQVPTNDILPDDISEDLRFKTMSWEPSFDGEVIPTDGFPSYLILLEKKDIKMSQRQHANAMLMSTIDRFTGYYLAGGDIDFDSLEDSDADNFIGYFKPAFKRASALGDKAHAREMTEYLRSIVYKPKGTIDIMVYGNPDAIALDIMRVDNNNYRILDVRHSISIEQKLLFTTKITGENIGGLNADPDHTARP